jgi:hypothetical protein
MTRVDIGFEKVCPKLNPGPSQLRSSTRVGFDVDRLGPAQTMGGAVIADGQMGHTFS